MTKTAQTVLITGATAGIGRHAALHLARAGHRVFATGSNTAALATLRAEAAAAGTPIETVRLDVTSADSIAAAVTEVDRLTDGRGLDALVNNAGYGVAAPTVETPDAEIRGQYETNVFGLMAVTRAFAPRMLARGAGRIVNISSAGGRVTLPLLGVYNSTKYAVESLSDALRRELLPFGVRVVLIEPGLIESEFSTRSMQSATRHQGDDSRYAPLFVHADALKRQADAFSAKPVVVSRAILHAITASRPAARYVVPFSTWLMMVFAAFTPTPVMDWILRTGAGLTRRRLGLTAGAPRAASATSVPASAAN